MKMDPFEHYDYLNQLSQIGTRSERTCKTRPDRILDSFGEEEFRQRFRFTKATFCYLVQLFGEELRVDIKRNNPVSPEIQLLLTLRFFAANTFQIVDGDTFGVHQNTVCRIVHRVSNVIALAARRFIQLTSVQERQEIAADFFQKHRFPGVVGVVDDTHVKIDNICIGALSQQKRLFFDQCTASAGVKFLARCRVMLSYCLSEGDFTFYPLS